MVYYNRFKILGLHFESMADFIIGSEVGRRSQVLQQLSMHMKSGNFNDYINLTNLTNEK